MTLPMGAPRPRRLRRRTQLLVIGFAGVALAAALGISHLLHRSSEPSPPPPTPRGEFRATPEERVNIAVAPVQVRSFPSEVTTDGKVATNDDRTTQIFPPFTGRVTHVFVTAGQAVRRGQPLATFAANEVIQAQSDLANARAAEHQASAQLGQARANYDRQAALYKADAAAKRDSEQARTDVAAAEQALSNAHAAAAAATGRVGVLNLSPQLPALRRASGAGRFLHEATLVSPVSGLVTQRQVGEGQFVNSVAGGGSQPLLAISDVGKLWLVANVRDTDAATIRVGALVRARIGALNGQSVAGRIDYVAPAVDPNTRRVIVRATLPNASGLLRPEMFAEITVTTGPARTSLSVPQSAVVFDGPQARIWIARPNGVFALREVTIGRTEDGFVEVLSGLSALDRVATGGALFLDVAGKNGQ